MGIFSSIAFQWSTMVHAGLPLFFWVNPRYTADQIPDQTGKVVIVTGGNSGTGYETAKALYDKGATVYLACRSTQRGEAAIEDIKKGTVFGLGGIKQPQSKQSKAKEESAGKKGRLEFLSLDLSDLDSVRRFAEEFQKRETKLDVLFANAGIMASPEGQYTKQGYTLQFGTNCLGHQRLISLLLPLLLATSKAQPASPSRVIITSSAGHSMAPKGGFDPKSVVRDDTTSTNSTGTKGKYEYTKWTEYGQSKWGNIATSRWLHWAYGPSEGKRKEAVEVQRAGDGEIISIAVHPGSVATNLAQHLSLTPIIIKWAPWAASLMTKTPAAGASNQLWVATCPVDEAKKLSGEYIVPFQHVGMARHDLDDPSRVKAVWDWCELRAKRNE